MKKSSTLLFVAMLCTMPILTMAANKKEKVNYKKMRLSCRINCKKNADTGNVENVLKISIHNGNKIKASVNGMLLVIFKDEKSTKKQILYSVEMYNLSGGDGEMGFPVSELLERKKAIDKLPQKKRTKVVGRKVSIEARKKKILNVKIKNVPGEKSYVGYVVVISAEGKKFAIKSNSGKWKKVVNNLLAMRPNEKCTEDGKLFENDLDL